MNNIFFNAIYKTFLSRILFLLARFVECGTDTGTDIWRYRSFDRWKLHECILHTRGRVFRGAFRRHLSIDTLMDRGNNRGLGLFSEFDGLNTRLKNLART